MVGWIQKLLTVGILAQKTKIGLQSASAKLINVFQRMNSPTPPSGRGLPTGHRAGFGRFYY